MLEACGGKDTVYIGLQPGHARTHGCRRWCMWLQARGGGAAATGGAATGGAAYRILPPGRTGRAPNGGTPVHVRAHAHVQHVHVHVHARYASTRAVRHVCSTCGARTVYAWHMHSAPCTRSTNAHPPHAQHARPGGVVVVFALAAHYGRVGIDRGRGTVTSARDKRDRRAGQSLPWQHGQTRHERRPDGSSHRVARAHHVAAAVLPRRALGGGRHGVASGHAW